MRTKRNRRVLAITLLMTSLLPTTVLARDVCVAPLPSRNESIEITERSRRRCIDDARISNAQPDVNPDTIGGGPLVDGWIRPGDPVFCEFIPYKMHLKRNGKSRKFWCYRTDREGRYFNDRFEISTSAAGVSGHGALIDRKGTVLRYEDGGLQRPDVIKVKYTTGDNRGREVYTEVAVSRFLWSLGFPADHMILAGVSCKGCSEDPFRDIRRASDNRPVDETNYFPEASIERKLSTSIETEPDEGFDWKEVYAGARWSDTTRMEFEAYILALNIVGFHNGRAKQNTVGCELGAVASQSGICSRPVLFLDDLGSTFGGGKARGRLERYRRRSVFRKTGSCELEADLAGFGRVSESARRFLVARLAVYDDQLATALFSSAGFDRESTDAATGAWAAAFVERLEEVRRTGCRQSES